MALRNTMLTVLLLFSATLQAQTTDTVFKKEWVGIDTLIVNYDLTKTALEKLEMLYEKAKKKQLHDQAVKCLIYQFTLQQRITDGSPAASFKHIEKELDQNKDETQQAILHALLAKLYRQYFNDHRWYIYDRKKTATTVSDDLATWNANDFLAVIQKHISQSLKNKKLLQQKTTEAYRAIILKGNSPGGHQTLYNLLVFEALDFYKSGDLMINLPANRQTITQEKALGKISDFLQADFTRKDSIAQQWLALQLYQELLAFHQQKKDTAALLLLNTERIEWVNSKAVLINKEALHTEALQEMVNRYPHEPATAQAWYLLASQLHRKATYYQPFGDTSNRYGMLQAEQMAEQYLKVHTDSSRGCINLMNLLTEIRKKEIRTETEAVNIPGKPFRALVSYRNIDTLYTRLIKLGFDEDLNVYSRETDYWTKLVKRKTQHSFFQVLPQSGDHQQHRTEIKLDGLPVGEYVLLSSASSKFDAENDHMSAQLFHVSDISYVRSGSDFFVLNRSTGKPMENVQVTVQKRVYSNTQKKDVFEKTAELISDKNGRFTVIEGQNVYGINFVFSKGNDRLNLKESDAIVYVRNEFESDDPVVIKRYERNNHRIFYFLDRAIYRPGQTLYFKGIAVTKDYTTQLSKVVSEKDSNWLYLKDANNRKIDSIRYKPNEFGSFNGSFRLPLNTLTGNFSLEASGKNQASTYFSVEEYKRPNFSVYFEKPKGAYRLNDTLTITGEAKAFAGNTVDGAKVVYNITVNTRYADPYFRRWPGPSDNGASIAQGEVKTGTDGKFTIRFIAKANEKDGSAGNPLFTYLVTADVTDRAGETRSGNTAVTAGYQSLLLGIETPSVTETDKLKRIKITSTNLGYENEPADVQLKIFALQSPGRAIRKRYWQRPDQFVLNSRDFLQSFPTDEYDEESNYLNWATGKQVVEGKLATKESLYFLLPNQLEPGYYRIEASAKDKDGVMVNTRSYFMVFNRNQPQLTIPSFQFLHTVNSMAEPGQTASFINGTSAEQVFVIRRTSRPRTLSGELSYFTRKQGLDSLLYQPTEQDRGGVNIEEVYVYNNRIYSTTNTIDVPWKNKLLTVSYGSYRDKTEPGSKETWTVNVVNNRSEKVPAELLTGMYDASLDQFKTNYWNLPYLWDRNYASFPFTGIYNFRAQNSREKYIPEKNIYLDPVEPERLAVNGSDLWNRSLNKWINDSTLHLSISLKQSAGMLQESVIVGYGTGLKKELAGSVSGVNVKTFANANPASIQIRGKSTSSQVELDYDKVFTTVDLIDPATGDRIINGRRVPAKTAATDGNNTVQLRKNFNETAFFFPQLYPDSAGNYRFSFTMPDALTRWKWMSLAHTKDLAFGSVTNQVITQKKLMIQPNAPRFMREGDNMEFSARIVNMSEKEITGQVSFELVDATTNTSVDGWFQNVFPAQYFTVEAGQSFPVKFPIQVPFSFNRPLTWRIIAKSGDFNDGEENTLPVLTNRVLVTETLPLLLQKDTTQAFSFDKLKNNNSESLSQEGLTIEFTTNPVWYAVQALPYLMEYPYECAEQTFNRFYANCLASFIVNKNPKIKQVFEQWKTDSSSLKSNLRKNEELKQVLLEETPWVMQAGSEEEQKKNIALLFDMIKLGNQTESLIEKLTQLQLPDGSFSWFKGGYSDRYITQYILTGIGKLKRLGALSPETATRIRVLLVNAIKFTDAKIAEDYLQIQNKKSEMLKQIPGSFQIEYLYMRSFFRDIAQQSQPAYDYYYNQGKQFWIKQNSYYRAQLGLVFFRNKEEKLATQTILPSLTENAVTDAKQGMYWKAAYTGNWYQNPVEHQSMMIAFMNEINSRGTLNTQINAMKTWLLLNKQTSNWKTTIATADACYALLLNGTDWLQTERTVNIQLGGFNINSTKEKKAAGSGYFKKRIDGKMVSQDMGNITVQTSSPLPQSTTNPSPAWGSVYWQYFEDIDKITPAASPLSINKKLFIEKNTENGKLLSLLKEGDELKPGDKVIIHMELRSDRDMDYLHLKDMRAASMEPVNTLSVYKWQDGLGYYESTKDASSNFFISHLRKGTYIFEYPVFITHAGNFSVGLATIQSMYAPEFSGHSEGMKIRVGN